MLKKEKKYLRILRKCNPLLSETADILMSDYLGELDAFKTGVIGVVAPSLLLYTFHIVKTALEKGIKTLYFLMRDGKILSEIAKRMISFWDLEIECKILYVSRHSLRNASYCKDENYLDLITLPSLNFTLKKLFARVLTEDETTAVCEEMGITTLESVLSREDIPEVKKMLSESKIFQKIVMKKSKKAYEITMEYFKNEGLFSSSDIHIVDVGWMGTMQTSLEFLLNTENENIRVSSFLFGLYQRKENITENNCDTYLFSPESGRKTKIRFNPNLFECFCANNSEMTVGYKKQSGKIIPVSKESEKSFDKVKFQQELILRFTDIFLAQSGDFPTFKSEKKMLAQLLRSLMTKPTKEEAIAFGSYEFDDDPKGSTENDLAPIMTFSELFRYGFFGKLFSNIGLIKRGVPSCFWPIGSIARSKVHMKALLRGNITLLRYVKYTFFKKR